MLHNYFRYLLLAVFFTAILLIVFLQFNSNRSINQLINGNESLMAELRLKNELQALQTAIVTAENAVKEAVIENEINQLNNLQYEVAGIHKKLTRLDSMINDKSTDTLLVKLQGFVHQKIRHNYTVLDSFAAKGKASAERLIDLQAESRILDSIKTTSDKISNLRQQTVTRLTQQAEADGSRAKALGTILAIVAALAAIFTFGYVSNRVRTQGLLINQLNQSEKKAREAVAIKENFMANMSHEIRTPLNAILGFTNLLQHKLLDEETRQYIQAIHSSGHNLLSIVNDVLDFSKIEAGMMRLDKAPFNISELVKATATMFKAKAAEKGLQLSLTCSDTIPEMLEGDATRLTQILSNLLGNAIKFTHKGAVHIAVNGSKKTGNSIDINFRVTDTGIGIDPERLPVIFERFRQADDNASRKYGGTGLGLSIVKELISLQKGSITAESAPGKGSTFSFTIPYKIASAASKKTTATTSTTLLTASHTHPVKILVAEDNPLNQKLLQHLFAKWQCEASIVHNGSQAVEALLKNTYHLLLLDIQMPEMDGYKAAQLIRQELKLPIPIIAMTAHALAGEREKCLAHGMNDYISKPFNETALYQLIKQYTNTLQNTNASASFQYINLAYLQEVSNGNKSYEQEIATDFIDILPQQLETMQAQLAQKKYTDLKKTAHNIKTTIAIMGLTDKLTPILDALEYSADSDELISQKISSLKNICDMAVAETRIFLQSIDKAKI
ncbi:MAG TPA: ATP-binding protein [Ferruginibacter sp.]|mgnify:CR=1 FL=1|nr:ATP-binding protein [Ferruginibacter sp.]HMP21404.1 ATP-binding protein [Ferruginibacter sp.]